MWEGGRKSHVRHDTVTTRMIPRGIVATQIPRGVTSRVKVFGYWLAAVLADVGQMLGKASHKGLGSLTNVYHFA